MATYTSAEELIVAAKVQLSSLSTLVTPEGYSLAVDQASQELGWSFPVTSPTKAFWLLQRTVRHSLNILRIASANKFKFKLVNLQQRFEHFQKMIEEMDKEFIAAMTSDVALFAGVDSYKLFGSKIDAGFSYNTLGIDTTYDIDNLVNFAPLESE